MISLNWLVERLSWKDLNCASRFGSWKKLPTVLIIPERWRISDEIITTPCDSKLFSTAPLIFYTFSGLLRFSSSPSVSHSAIKPPISRDKVRATEAARSHSDTQVFCDYTVIHKMVGSLWWETVRIKALGCDASHNELKHMSRYPQKPHIQELYTVYCTSNSKTTISVKSTLLFSLLMFWLFYCSVLG